MNTTDLYNLFRQDTVDLKEPYLWSDLEVFTYMDEAHMAFTRWGVGIADTSTDEVTRIPVVAGEEYAPLHNSILQIRKATLASNKRPVILRNLYDASTMANDYGVFTPQLEHRPGIVRGMVIGEEQDQCRWVGIPEEDDTVIITVYRLPLEKLDRKGQELEIRREHHHSLLLWMKHLAYKKQDAETFDRAKSKENGDEFMAYCERSKLEWERYKHKPRTMQYGGIQNFGDMSDGVRRSW